MLYLANPSSGKINEAMTGGLLGCITTPKQGNRIPDKAVYCCDNGRYGKGWPGEVAWFTWIQATLGTYGRERCLFATAPDVVADATATLGMSVPLLQPIRSLGIPAAFVAQDGSEHGLVPWGQFDVLFLGGTTDWKLGPGAAALTREAHRQHTRIHMGRVNSRKRIQYADSLGCHSVDGTYLTFGPDVNLPKLLRWMGEVNQEMTLF